MITSCSVLLGLLHLSTRTGSSVRYVSIFCALAVTSIFWMGDVPLSLCLLVISLLAGGVSLIFSFLRCVCRLPSYRGGSPDVSLLKTSPVNLVSAKGRVPRVVEL
jgi:hypothetical protein